jgi:long-subunit fatty acid transport protein
MKHILGTTALIAMASGAFAGGVDRSGQSVGVIFEEGTYAEFSLGLVNPDVSGTLGGANSGNVAESYTQIGAAYKWNYGGDWDAAVIFHQPFGADVDYPTGTGYPLAGSNATLSSLGISGVAQYNLDGGMSVFGGVRAESLEMDVTLSGGYVASGDKTWGFGYLIGAAYERPDIALRVALTYNSAIDYEIDTNENIAGDSTTDVTSPQSVNLEFQTGIAADTLLFGSVRWADWEQFQISPIGFATANPASPNLVSFDDATTTFSLGVGRRINENWSAAVTLGYEEAGGTPVSNLGPTDGSRSIGVGATYTEGNIKITGGARYIEPGDATTTIGANFEGNSAIALGLKIGIQM